MSTAWRPLPEDLTRPERELAQRLRSLKDTAGVTLAELGSKTHYTRSSWQRWLNGERLATRPAVLGLAEVLGADPAPLLILLDRAEAAAKDPDSRAAAPPVAPVAPAPIAQLPADIADFSGRAIEIGRLLSALSDGPERPGQARVCTVIGGGGLGKTTLAVHVAHLVARDYPDGQLYVDLRGADPSPRDPGEALASFLSAFGIPTGELPADLEGRASRFRTVLSGRRVLIVLDNARDPAQIRPLIPAAPGCAVLITSRGMLSGLAGAQRLALDLLPARDALDLFEHLVGAERAASEPDAVASILESCARLPLALRIAGARVADRPSWSLERFAARLADQHRRLDELSVDDLAVRASFELSYDYLSSPVPGRTHSRRADAARTFRLAALIPARAFDADEVAALLGDEEEAADEALEHLVDIHLLADDGDGRYAFHDLVRSYALQLVEEYEPADERTRAVRRLTSWYAVGVEAAAESLDGSPRRLPISDPEPGTPKAPGFPGKSEAVEWVSWHCEALYGAIDAAGAGGRPDVAARIAVHIMPYVFVDMTIDWRAWLERALRVVQGSGDLASEAYVRQRLGVCHGLWERADECVDELEAALALHRECEDPLGEMGTLQNLGFGYALQQQHERALECARLALVLYSRTPDVPGGFRDFEAQTYSAMASTYLEMLLYEDSVEHYQRSIDLYPPGSRDVAISLSCMGDGYRGLGRFEEAVDSVQQGIKLAADIDDRFLQGDGLDILGRVYEHFGRPRDARDSWNQALAIFEGISFTPGLERVRKCLAALDEEEGAGVTETVAD